MADENGMNCELQLTRPDVRKVKLQPDAIYEKWRNVDFATASPEIQAQYLQDQNTSIAMWDQLNLPDFNIWDNSFGESTRAENNSAPYNGDLAGTQEPLISSNIPLPSRIGDVSSMRPSSVMQATAVPPNIPSGNRIARPEGKGKISAVRSNTLENG